MGVSNSTIDKKFQPQRSTVGTTSSEPSTSSPSANQQSSNSSNDSTSNKPNFQWVGGRKFMEAPNILPCDDREKDRTVMQYFMLKGAFGGIIHAPIVDVLSEGGRILDIGCGAAAWCMDVAQAFPKTFVLGVDIVADFPSSVRPPNCDFRLMDALKWPLPFEDDSFDLISIQIMVVVVTTQQWPGLLAEVNRILKPGGWLQWMEGDCTAWDSGPIGADFNEKLLKTMRLRNLDPLLPRQFVPLLMNTGYETIERKFISFYFGDWAGPYGKVMAENIIEVASSTGPIFCTIFGWSTEQLQQKLVDMRKEMEEYKGYINYHLAIACKPKPAL